MNWAVALPLMSKEHLVGYKFTVYDVESFSVTEYVCCTVFPLLSFDNSMIIVIAGKFE